MIARYIIRITFVSNSDCICLFILLFLPPKIRNTKGFPGAIRSTKAKRRKGNGKREKLLLKWEKASAHRNLPLDLYSWIIICFCKLSLPQQDCTHNHSYRLMQKYSLLLPSICVYVSLRVSFSLFLSLIVFSLFLSFAAYSFLSSSSPFFHSLSVCVYISIYC